MWEHISHSQDVTMCLQKLDELFSSGVSADQKKENNIVLKETGDYHHERYNLNNLHLFDKNSGSIHKIDSVGNLNER